jgi:hypothetical protein
VPHQVNQQVDVVSLNECGNLFVGASKDYSPVARGGTKATRVFVVVSAIGIADQLAFAAGEMLEAGQGQESRWTAAKFTGNEPDSQGRGGLLSGQGRHRGRQGPRVRVVPILMSRQKLRERDVIVVLQFQ